MSDSSSISVHPVCSYQSYDPVTLEPLNRETRIRVQELNRVLPAVAGRTVLDIGCNGGLVSILSAQAGATAVHAVDVNLVQVEALQQISTRLGLNVVSERRGFWALGPADVADVVFALEVVHWVVHQGGQLEPICQKLHEVVGSVLFLETPWDQSEPSIAHRANESLEQYSARDLVRGLLSVGFRVEILHFSSYFAGTSSRVMIRAEKN